MIVCENVRKRQEDFYLEDIAFSLPEGYIMGLIGANGAGKSTILRLLLGLIRPDSGKITLFGTNYDKGEREIKNQIGYVLVEGGLFSPDLTVLGNANLYGKYYQNYEETLFCSYCEEFQLELKKKLGKLSKGEKLKFQFAFALAHHPRLLILDEPTANFDPDFRKQFLHIITDFIKDGKHSVILATHLTADLDMIADYITLIDKGKMLFSMDRENINKHFRMVQGDEYKVNLLRKENIIYKEKGKFGTKAFVRNDRWSLYDPSLTVQYPTIEELMYYLLKAKKSGGK